MLQLLSIFCLIVFSIAVFIIGLKLSESRSFDDFLMNVGFALTPVVGLPIFVLGASSESHRFASDHYKLQASTGKDF
jgi:hypothetical protein